MGQSKKKYMEYYSQDDEIFWEEAMRKKVAAWEQQEKELGEEYNREILEGLRAEGLVDIQESAEREAELLTKWQQEILSEMKGVKRYSEAEKDRMDKLNGEVQWKRKDK